MPDQPTKPSAAAGAKPRKPKTSLDYVKDIDDALANIHDVNELTFIWNRVRQRIDAATAPPVAPAEKVAEA